MGYTVSHKRIESITFLLPLPPATLYHLLVPQTAAQLANLRPFRTREEALPTLQLAWAAKKRNAENRKLRKSRAKGKVTHARLADAERRVADLESQVAELTRILKRAKLLKDAKPRPAVGDDIPTLAKPPPSPAQPGPEPG